MISVLRSSHAAASRVRSRILRLFRALNIGAQARASGGVLPNICLVAVAFAVLTEVAWAQSSSSVIERRLLAIQDQIDIRFSSIERSIESLTNILERMKREQGDLSQQTLGMIDEIRYQIADLRQGIETGGIASIGTGVAETPGEEQDAVEGLFGVIRTPVDETGNLIEEEAVAVPTGASSPGTASDAVGPGAGPEATGDPNTVLSLLDEISGLENAALAEQAPQEQFDAALDNLRDGFEQDAVKGFEAFLEMYPEHELTAEAKFWLAESHFGLEDYAKAANAYFRVFREHSGEPRAADSLLRVGMSLIRVGKKDGACVAFKQVDVLFPNAPERLRNRARIEATRAECN